MGHWSWGERVVAHLSQSKAEGRSFDVAWARAMKTCPPRGGDAQVPAVDGVATLFDESGEVEESVADAMRAFCFDAWHGQRPVLARFTLESLRDSDASSAAHRVGEIRTAA